MSFRGSASIQNWVSNLDVHAIDTPLCKGCTAHRGFYLSWLSVRSPVTDALKSLSTAHPTYTIIATGHSLGGALATLAAADLRNTGYTVTLYTFGAPRISSAPLARYITAQAGGNYRVTHWSDPVPNLPPIFMGFAHVSPEYYINLPNNKPVGAKDVKVYEGETSLKGNAAWILPDILSHWYYLGKLSGTCALF